MYISLAFMILWAPCFLLEEETTVMSDVRKIYGMSYNDQKCDDYFITFKCMTACKSNGFFIFRLDYLCKCTCHDVSTPTILPYFKWRTKGTTRSIPKTQSVSLYHIIGTLSPTPTKPTTTVSTTTEFTCPPVEALGGSGSGSGSGSGDGGDDAGDDASPDNKTKAEGSGADEEEAKSTPSG